MASRPAPTLREAPTVAGLATGVRSSFGQMGLEAPQGTSLGYSPFGGVTAVSDRAPETVQVAATGPGVFGAMGGFGEAER